MAGQQTFKLNKVFPDHCNKFCKAVGAKFETRAAQNNHMMAQYLKKSLTAASSARLEPYQVHYMFKGVEYGRSCTRLS